ncbi:ATP-binding protein [Candidatus Magnetomorum sp. HK-1]|nr:ATP-binding protein [Candidatus Magnetomorum sp. HK-1]
MKKTIPIDFIDKLEQAKNYQRNYPEKALSDLLKVIPARFENGCIPETDSILLLKNIIFDPKDFPDTPLVGKKETCFSGLNDRLNNAFQQEMKQGKKTLPKGIFENEIKDDKAVKIAYADEMKTISEYLRNNLSVLVICDRILTEFIYQVVCTMANKELVLDTDSYVQSDHSSKMAQVQNAASGGPSDYQKNLQLLLNNQQDDQLLVLRTLEMLDNTEMIELVYRNIKDGKRPQLLAFVDPSIEVKKVLTDRFAVHVSIMGLPRYVKDQDGKNIYTVSQLITQKEHDCFTHFHPEDLFKKVAGLNAIQFRNAMKYVAARVLENKNPKQIFDLLLNFKKSTSEEIEIPTIRFKDIGGYEKVKHQLKRIIRLIDSDVAGMEPDERLKLIPRGFIFYGPPGTGKTLFAKAIANEMNATIQMVSGPEIMDKYVGQSENNLRRIFSTARRNAPSVVFFDEFDSIASQRSTYSDGGARANNAVVAQLLTELDGFREDQTVLVIGTSNRIDIIDQALLRPSRLRPVEIKRPEHAARKEVARIHAQKFGVDQLLINLFILAKEYVEQFRSSGRHIPQAFYDTLFEKHPPYKDAFSEEEKQADFARDIKAYFDFITRLSKDNSFEADDLIPKLKEKLSNLGKNYGVNISEQSSPEIQDTNPGFLPMQTDIYDLFSMIASHDQKGLSKDIYLNTTLNLVAEYTKGFNNDEIRAVFQEASLEHHMEGQLITPRYIAQRIGLIQKRRDEREAMREK